MLLPASPAPATHLGGGVNLLEAIEHAVLPLRPRQRKLQRQLAGQAVVALLEHVPAKRQHNRAAE